MPKRSNEFQKLIRLLEKQFASESASVEESKLLEDFRNGQKREVDIFIETKIGEHPVGLAIECRDHKRKVGMQWIDDLIGKYQYLPIHKVIAVSKSGFYDSAYEAARQSNIELLSLEDAIEEDWVRAVNNMDAMFFTAIRFRPIEITFDSELALFEKDISKIKTFNDQNEELGNLKEYSLSLLRQPQINSSIQKALTSNFDEEKEEFKKGNIADVKWTPKNKIVIRDDFDFASQLDSITYRFICEVNQTSIPTEKFSYNDAQVATITKEMHDMKLIMSVSESKKQEPTLAISMEIENSQGETFTEDIITAPLPTYDGAIHFLRYILG